MCPLLDTNDSNASFDSWNMEIDGNISNLLAQAEGIWVTGIAWSFDWNIYAIANFYEHYRVTMNRKFVNVQLKQNFVLFVSVGYRGFIEGLLLFSFSIMELKFHWNRLNRPATVSVSFVNNLRHGKP